MSNNYIDIEEIYNYTASEIIENFNTHFSNVYLTAVNNVGNSSDNQKWIEVYKIWKYLSYLKYAKKENIYPDLNFTECLLKRWPYNGNYKLHFPIDNDVFNFPISNNPILTNPFAQNLFQTILGVISTDLLDINSGHISAKTPTDPLTFIGKGGMLVEVLDNPNRVILTPPPTLGNPIFNTEMDGSITMPVDHGGYPAGTTVEDVRNLFITNMLEVILFPPIFDGYTAPTSYLEGEEILPATGFSQNKKILQVGNADKYHLKGTFIQNDAGVIDEYRLYKDNVFLSNNQLEHEIAIVLNDPGQIAYRAEIDFADGPILQDTHGNDHPVGQIMHGTLNTNTVIYKWILPIYYGSDADGLSIDPTLGTKRLIEIGTSLIIDFPSDGAAWYYLAVPAGTPEYIKYFITEISKGSMSSGNAWEPSVPITITDDNFVAKDFDLYRTGYITQFNLPVKFLQS